MTQELTEHHMVEVSNLVNSYLDKEDWSNAKKTLEKEISIYPNEYWLLTTLSMVFYEQRLYDKALSLSEKALVINSTDYLVLNHHALILSVIDGKEKEAIKLLTKIIGTDLNKIAYGKHGEGMNWAKSIVNDCRVRLALVYHSLSKHNEALIQLETHLRNRRRGLFSNYTKKWVLNKFDVLSHKGPRKGI